MATEQAVLQYEFAEAFFAELAEHVDSVVVSPGSRSTPLVLSAVGYPVFAGEQTSASRLKPVVVLDERSAGFVALGLAKASPPACGPCLHFGHGCGQLSARSRGGVSLPLAAGGHHGRPARLVSRLGIASDHLPKRSLCQACEVGHRSGCASPQSLWRRPSHCFACHSECLRPARRHSAHQLAFGKTAGAAWLWCVRCRYFKSRVAGR